MKFARKRPIAAPVLFAVDLVGTQEYDGQVLEMRQSAAPSPADLQNCPRIADRLPMAVWLVSIVSLCERFCYYGFVGPFRKCSSKIANNVALTS